MRYALFIFLGITTIAAGQPAPQQEYCRTVAAGSQHGEALVRFCEFVLTLREKLPNVICEETMKNDTGGFQRQTVTAEVRHEDGRDSYSKIMRNEKPFTSPISELPGSWSEGEFGSVLRVVFAQEAHTQFKFLKETRWHSAPALLFEFQVARENNRRWFLQVGVQKVYPGIQGKVWLDASSSAVLRLDMAATDLDRPIPPENRRFVLEEVHKSIEYANVHLGDGTDFVLPASSEELKCLRRGWCYREQITFKNCHKFGVKSRILDEVSP